MKSRAFILVSLMALSGVAAGDAGKDTSGLRLIPFPKEVKWEAGAFALDRPLVLGVQEDSLWVLGPEVREEFARAGLAQPTLHAIKGKPFGVVLSPSADTPVGDFAFREKPAPEDYVLRVQPEAVAVGAPDAAGLFYGVQTLCQLIRANRQGNSLPCLTVRDWPCAIAWRGYQDDLTRGPSSTYETLRREVAVGAFFKLNLFTYYMEQQFAFKKHPIIGPVDGSLTPEELKALVEFAAPYHVNILGNQQSFAHFENILRHPEYKHLAENDHILCPAKDESYQFLDDLYSEVAPLLPFPFFNVCCDETQGLGEGPSKELCAQIGVGGVYAQHVSRIHDILKTKYDKRMMMWGDIILGHADQLGKIPKDTVMLSWGYEPSESFEGQILPFTQAGFEFFVCPSVRNYGRILPDFRGATINIQNFIRDGAKHGVLGVINTAWDDGGRTMNAPNWHGHAWGAECSWNASTTPADVFNRRIGAVLFGEQGDHFGQAIETLAKVQDIPMTAGHNDDRFWMSILAGEVKMASVEAARSEAQRLVEIVNAGREHLVACQQDAKANADLLDYYLFGVKRFEQLGRTLLDSLDAAAAYDQATRVPPNQAGPLLEKAESLARKTCDGYRALQSEERYLYLRENRPYGAEVRPKWYQDKFIAPYDALASRLKAAREGAAAGKPLPGPKDIGLAVTVGG